MIILISLLVLLTACSAFFSGSETTMFSLSPIQIKSFRTSSDTRKQKVARLLSRPRDLLVTILIFNIILNILIQNIASDIFREFNGWYLKVGLPLVLTLIFGEIIPKSLAIQNNKTFSIKISSTLNRLRIYTTPLRIMLIKIAGHISKLIFFCLKKNSDISENELQYMLHTSQKDGIITDQESRLIDGFLELQNSSVKEIMIPREDIIFFDASTSIDRLSEIFQKHQFSKIPVCLQDLDNFNGVITAENFLKNEDTIQTPKDLQPYLSKPLFIPETSKAQALIEQLNRHNNSLALVVDEYGSISGMVSKKDIFDVIVENITEKQQDPLFSRTGPNIIIASGKLEISEIKEIFNIELTSYRNVITIGGWLTEKIGDIPRAGVQYEYKGLLFHVLAASTRRIKKVYIRKVNKSSTI